MKRILVYGGTFDPPHVAHVRLPPLVADRLNCGRLLYVPARVNPLKADEPPTNDAHRLAMLTLALHENPDAEICTVELERAGLSYTVDTLRELQFRSGPNVKIVLLIGVDQALNFHRWKDWQKILKQAEVAVVLRPPWDRQRFAEQLQEHCDAKQTQRWLDRIVDVPLIDISATEVRNRLSNGENLNGLLDPAVVRYIREHGLYRQQTAVE